MKIAHHLLTIALLSSPLISHAQSASGPIGYYPSSGSSVSQATPNSGVSGSNPAYDPTKNQVNFPNLATTLPRVDARHPDFGSGMPLGGATLGGTCSSAPTLTVSAPNATAGAKVQATITAGCTSAGIPYVTHVYGGAGYLAAGTTITSSTSTVTATPAFYCTAGAADPTGTNDSTCAIQEAVNYAESNPQAGKAQPAIYLATGSYLVSHAIRIPCSLHFVGDGMMASVLEATNPTENGITIIPSVSNPQLDVNACDGSLEHLSVVAYPNKTASGHLYTATLIESSQSPAYRLFDVRGANSGGRGFSTSGNSERQDLLETQWENDYRSVILNNNEERAINIYIQNPAVDNSGYCESEANCVNGVFPGATFTVAQSLLSASSDGTDAFYVIKGGSDAGSTNGTSPLLAGHHFTTSGITGNTSLDGLFTITHVYNQCGAATTASGCTDTGVSNEYVIEAANTSSGTGTGGTYLPTVMADYHAQLVIGGANPTVMNGSIKSLQYSACIQDVGSYSGMISGFYCEGYPVNGQPRESPDVQLGGVTAHSTLTSAMSTGTSPVQGSAAATLRSTADFINYTNDPMDIYNSDTFTFIIEPADFTLGSTACSNAVPKVGGVCQVEQDQFELVSGEVSRDGFHVYARGVSGSTVSGIAWPAGSIVAEYPGGFYFGPIVQNMHLETIDPPGSNWTSNCNDATVPCASVIAGGVPDGIVMFPKNGGENWAGTRYSIGVSATFINDEWWGVLSVANEPWGSGYIKSTSIANITNIGGGGAQPSGETSEALSGVLQENGGPGIVAVTYSDGSTGLMNFTSPTSGTTYDIGGYGAPFYSSKLLSSNLPYFGGSPYGAGGVSIGDQFTTSHCFFDLPSAAYTHSLVSDCISGGPSITTPDWRIRSWDTTSASWNNILFGEVSGTTTNFLVGPYKPATASVTSYGALTGVKNNYWTSSGTAATAEISQYFFANSATTAPASFTYADQIAGNNSLPVTRDLSGYSAVKVPAASYVGTNYMVGSASASPTGACVANGYITAVINGVQVHLATCQ